MMLGFLKFVGSLILDVRWTVGLSCLGLCVFDCYVL